MGSPTKGMWTCRHGVDGRDFCEQCCGPLDTRQLNCWWCLIGRCQHPEQRDPRGHQMPAAAIEGGHSICAPCAAAKQALETAVRECWPLPGEEQAGG